MLALQDTLNWALPYVEYSPLTAGTAANPAITIASMVRNTYLSAPLSWAWNRNENSSQQTTAGIQDYTIALTDFGFLEKASLTDVNGNTYEIKDIYNNLPLSATSLNAPTQARPNALAVILNNVGTNIKIRFLSAPDAIYTLNLTYQMLAIPFTPNVITSAANASGGSTVYTGVFTTSLFVTNNSAMIVGFGNSVNNGTFPIVSVTGTTLTVANPNGVAQTTTSGYGINSSWYPLPDSHSNAYNNLFLAEALAATDDARSQIYRQRGVASLLAKADGLTEMQRNSFIQQYLNYGRENQSVVLKLQQATQGRGV